MNRVLGDNRIALSCVALLASIEPATVWAIHAKGISR
jgi:hypothetical protein